MGSSCRLPIQQTIELLSSSSWCFAQRDVMRAKGIALDTVRYCITDCSENLLRAWRTNSYLAEFAECGMLEFDLLQAGEEIKSRFVSGHGPGTSEPTSAPLVLIANYVFDSLPQDAFVIQQGQIFEALVTTMTPSGSTP